MILIGLIKREKNERKQFGIILIILAIVGMIIMPFNVCKAASATINVSTDTPDVIIGDEVIVSLQLSSEALIGDFEAYITYNDDVLEFQSGASFIAGGEGLLKLSDINVATEEYSRKYIVKFKTKKIGSSDIIIKEKAAVYDYESGLNMSVSSNRLNISVIAAKTASTNAKLKSLKISPSALEPEFESTTMEYTTKVTNDLDQLIISALPEEKSATVTIQGNDKLIVGTNKIVVTITAESGDTKEYIIKATKEDKVLESETEGTMETADDQSENPSDTNNEETFTQINNILVTKDGENTYIQNGYRYRISTPSNDTDIPEGYTKTTLTLNDITMDAYTFDNDVVNEFLLLYVINEEGEAGFYQYDKIEKTLQRYIGNQNVNTTNKYVKSNELIHSEEYKNKLITMGIIIAVLGAIIITMSIILIHIYTKSRD